jgi:hypothetical protein
MPVKRLPSNPDLEHFKYQAKDLLRGHAARHPDVAQQIREFHPDFIAASDSEIFNAALSLSATQLTIARAYGFPSWPRLKAHVESPALPAGLNRPFEERIEDPIFRRAVDLLDAGEANGLRQHLKQNPKLVHQHVTFEGGNCFRNPTLLEFSAENPIRKGKLPANIVEIATAILNAGTDLSAMEEALGLVSTESISRECSVQIPLIDLLTDRGADPNGALQAAVAHGEFHAAGRFNDFGGSGRIGPRRRVPPSDSKLKQRRPSPGAGVCNAIRSHLDRAHAARCRAGSKRLQSRRRSLALHAPARGRLGGS